MSAPAVNESAIPLRPSGVRPRLDAIDLWRGVIMLLMALDHTRDFLHHDVLQYSPTDLTKASAALFLTRWVTHFCAPVFCFFGGAAAFLSLGRGKTTSKVSRFLITRDGGRLRVCLIWLAVVLHSICPAAGSPI